MCESFGEMCGVMYSPVTKPAPEKTTREQAEMARIRLQKSVEHARAILGYNAEIVHAIEEAIRVFYRVEAGRK